MFFFSPELVIVIRDYREHHGDTVFFHSYFLSRHSTSGADSNNLRFAKEAGLSFFPPLIELPLTRSSITSFERSQNLSDKFLMLTRKHQKDAWEDIVDIDNSFVYFLIIMA